MIHRRNKHTTFHIKPLLNFNNGSDIANICVEVTLQKETLASQEDPMNVDVLTTRVADGIAVITLGSAKRIYFDAEMGDVLTEALEGFAGDPTFAWSSSPAAPRVISIVTSISHPLL